MLNKDHFQCFEILSRGPALLFLAGMCEYEIQGKRVLFESEVNVMNRTILTQNGY